MREGPGAIDDRETVEVYMEETGEMYNVYRMVDEKYETFDDNEDEYQLLRLCDKTNDETIGMIKMQDEP
eukprot:327434-Amphidinium_carterae.1